MRRALFIINPKAGKGQPEKIRNTVATFLRSGKMEGEIVFTRHAGHGGELAAGAGQQGFDTVVAVSGDGSVNELASAIINSGVSLGILPCGSGNGVARHFGIPMGFEAALQVIATGISHSIDTGTVNGRRFIMLTGVGFDATVARSFNLQKTRGLSTYARLSVATYFNIVPRPFTIRIDDQVMHRKALMVVVANCSQFGNNARIAPGARADDGLFNISILKKAPVHRVPALAWHLFAGTLAPGPLVEMYSGRSVTIEQESDYCQLDGEYFAGGRKLEIGIDPLSLNIISPMIVA